MSENFEVNRSIPKCDYNHQSTPRINKKLLILDFSVESKAQSVLYSKTRFLEMTFNVVHETDDTRCVCIS